MDDCDVCVARYSNVGMRRVSSAQSSPIASGMRCLTPATAGAGMTICQTRVMFSRSSWPNKRNIHAITSGKALLWHGACHNADRLVQVKVEMESECSGGARRLQCVARRDRSAQGVECSI